MAERTKNHRDKEGLKNGFQCPESVAEIFLYMYLCNYLHKFSFLCLTIREVICLWRLRF